MSKRVLADQDKPYSKARKFKNTLHNWVTNPYNILVLISIILLFALVVTPLLDMIVTTFKVGPKDASRAKAPVGEFTLYYWQRLFNSMISKNMLNAAGLPWSRTEAWIDTERMLQVTFTTSVLIEEEE